MIFPGWFGGKDITNTNRGYRLPGTVGSPTQAADATFELLGADELLQLIAELPDNAMWHLGYALRIELDYVIQDAKANYVPRDTGRLARAGFSKGPVRRGSAVEVWGGFKAVRNMRGSMYTIPVHEIPAPPQKSVGGLSATHEHGSWKFLQIPYLAAQPGMRRRIAERIWHSFKNRKKLGLPS